MTGEKVSGSRGGVDLGIIERKESTYVIVCEELAELIAFNFKEWENKKYKAKLSNNYDNKKFIWIR